MSRSFETSKGSLDLQPLNRSCVLVLCLCSHLGFWMLRKVAGLGWSVLVVDALRSRPLIKGKHIVEVSVSKLERSFS